MPHQAAETLEERPLLSVVDLKVHFGGRSLLGGTPVVRAVDGVTLAVHPGRTLGLVGESGSGKSTLGRAIMGLERHADGHVSVGAYDVTAGGAELREARRLVQMVFQDPASSMNPALTVGEVISEPLVINGIGSRSSRRTRSQELLELVELPAEAADRFPHEFSGGQRQRAAIARALALEPSLIICDEAVSALDVSVQAQVVNLLARLQRELGLALLFIAHDLAVVRHISDDVAVMYMGQIVEKGARENVYGSPRHPYTRMLMASAPVPDPRVRRGRAALAGDVPDPSAPPSGCRFHPRCPIARPGLCDVEAPVLRRVSATQESACHLADELVDELPLADPVNRSVHSSAAPEVH